MRDLTILFVDDEQDILDALKRRLRTESYNKVFVSSAKAALDIVRAQPVHIVIADIQMPVMDGLTLLREIKKDRPDIVRMVLSGMTDVSRIIFSINSGEVFRYIVKPIDEATEFRSTIHEAIDYYLLCRDRAELISKLKQKNKELTDALDHVQRLEGLIPICAMCKKVREDDDYWQEVEKYIEGHSSARFTHSFCPDCFHKHIEPGLDSST